ncbi:MAG TPA: GH25 family lysozyme [Chroococcales cyanobacterium]
MKCEKCGKRLQADWNFCPFCAHGIPSSSTGRPRRTGPKQSYRGILKPAGVTRLDTFAESELARAAQAGQVLIGVGVSDPEGRLDWQKMQTSGVAFAFIRASHGDGGKDYAARQNMTRCRSAGIIPGLYHYFLGYADPARQAMNFLSVVDALGVGDSDLPPGVDLKGLRLVRESPQEQHEKLHVWLNAVQEKMKRKVVIFNGGLAPFDCDDCTNWTLSDMKGEITKPYFSGDHHQLLDFIDRSQIDALI